MAKPLALLLVCAELLLAGNLFAADWVPPDNPEPPLLGEPGADDSLLLPAAAAGVLALSGLTLSALGTYGIFSNAAGGFDDPALQGGIVMTLSGGLLTAAGAVVMSWLFDAAGEAGGAGHDSSDQDELDPPVLPAVLSVREGDQRISRSEPCNREPLFFYSE